jgi:Fe-S-cluster containining protein
LTDARTGAVSAKKTKISREDLKPGECLCDHCTGKCCRYFSLPIDTPTTWDDYDAVRWYLAHGQTLVYVEKETWYLVVMTRCKYLTRDDRCRIYLNRPKICRDYTTKECEYDEDWSFTQVFETPEQLWEYAEAVLPPRRRRKPRGAALPVVSITSAD